MDQTQNELLALTKRLVEIPSENPGNNEMAAAQEITSILQNEGIRAEISHSPQERPNVIARLEGRKNGPTLLFNGHTDVVPPGEGWSREAWKPTVEEGRLYGRGTADMKGGIACMMYAAIQLQRMGRPFAGTLILLFNADEEHGNLGIRHYLQNPIPADYVVIGEPTGLHPCIGHKGDCRVRISTHGQAAHCAIVQDPDNAVYKLARVIKALEGLSKQIGKRTSAVGNASLSVTVIGGGSAPNIVPDHAWLELDRRILPGETRKNVLLEIEDCIRSVLEDGWELECYLYFTAHSISPDNDLVRVLKRIAEGVTGSPREPCLFQASTEAPFFSVDQGIPTVIIGPGSLEQAHKPDEFVEVEQLLQAANIYEKAARELLGGI